MSVYKDLSGTMQLYFQIGLGTNGVRLKNNSGVLEARNAADDAFLIVRGATPVGDSDLVTKKYADSLTKPIRVLRGADCSVALPDNTAVRGFVVVQIAGSGAAVGDILYDDGSESGSMEILTAIEGRCIATTDALAGGTANFDADSIYIWDEDNSIWVKIGDIGSVTGPLRVIRKALTNAAQQDSTLQVPAGAYIRLARIAITTPYSGGATLSLGDTTVADKFMTTVQNLLQATAGTAFEVEQDTQISGLSVIRATIAGNPAAGASVMYVVFTVPNV